MTWNQLIRIRDLLRCVNNCRGKRRKKCLLCNAMEPKKCVNLKRACGCYFLTTENNLFLRTTATYFLLFWHLKITLVLVQDFPPDLETTSIHCDKPAKNGGKSKERLRDWDSPLGNEVVIGFFHGFFIFCENVKSFHIFSIFFRQRFVGI